MTQGERIRALRKELGLTLEKFAEPIGVKKAAISNIENDTRGLTDQMIISICREYNASEEWLRTGNGSMFIPLSREEEISRQIGRLVNEDNDFKKRLVSCVLSLTEEQLKLLEEIAKKLVKEKD